MDCNKTINYLKEKARMCHVQRVDCINCVFNEFQIGLCNVPQKPEAAVAVVQKWSDEHPIKTYARDFFEKFPNAPKDDKGMPHVCREYIYAPRFDKCYDWDDCCSDCWNEPMEV